MEFTNKFKKSKYSAFSKHLNFTSVYLALVFFPHLCDTSGFCSYHFIFKDFYLSPSVSGHVAVCLLCLYCCRVFLAATVAVAKLNMTVKYIKVLHSCFKQICF